MMASFVIYTFNPCSFEGKSRRYGQDMQLDWKKEEKHTQILLQSLTEGDHLEYRNINERMVLKQIASKQGC
jgi:hypothetical protein